MVKYPLFVIKKNVEEKKYRYWVPIASEQRAYMEFDEILAYRYGDEKVVPMRFVGVKDMNDNDVYEMDILRLDEDWQKKYVGLYSIPFPFEDIVSVNPDKVQFLPKFEIIGNMWENPEIFLHLHD